MYGDHFCPTVSYKPFSSISTQSPCTETTFHNSALHTIVQARYKKSMNGNYFLVAHDGETIISIHGLCALI
jgi:hypothetical protein